MTTGRHRELPILNPNLLALKAAETLADLHRMGKYTISRAGSTSATSSTTRPRPTRCGGAGAWWTSITRRRVE